MPDFSFPNWMLQQNTFADSLLKGVQAGSVIANIRYRNQALAAQAIDAERNYALREKALAVDQEQKDIMIKSRLLEMETNKQMLADQVSDKEALTTWISERNKLSPEERLNMPVPNLKLPASFNVANQIFDNDRMAYQQSEKGRAEVAMDLAVKQIPPSYRLRYYSEPNPAARMQILEEGEEAAKTAALDLYRPREMKTDSGETLFYNPKTGTFRFAPEAVTDEVTTRPVTNEEGKVIGHVMRSGNKWIRIPEESISKSKELLMRSELAEVNEQVKLMELTPAEAANRRSEIEAKYTGAIPTSAPASKATPTIGEIRRGYKFLGGNPADPASWQKLP